LSAFENNSKLGCSFCNYQNIIQKETIIDSYQKWYITKERVFDPVEFRFGLISDGIFGSVWNKLYKKEIIDSIYFSEGRLNEDFLFCWEVSASLLEKKLEAFSVSATLYYYRITPNGLSKGDTKIRGALDVLLNSISVKKEVANDNILCQIAEQRYYAHLLGFAMQAFTSSENNYKYREYQKMLGQISVCYLFNTLGIRHRLGYLVLRFIPLLWRYNIVHNFCTKHGEVPPINLK